MSKPGDKEKYMVQICDAVPEDAEGIIAVQQKTWLATYPNEEYGITVEDIKAKDFTSPERVERWRKSIETQSETGHIWVAKDGEAIIGFCVAGKEKDVGGIRAVYLLPEYQGKGVGKMLIETAFEWLGAKSDIVVNVAKYNTGSIEFYKKTGFEEVGEVESSSVARLPSGKVIPEIQMVRKGRLN